MREVQKPQIEPYEHARAAMGAFLVEFAILDSQTSTAVLRHLCLDSTLVGYLPELVDFGNRLKLIKRIAKNHPLPKPLAEDLDAALNEAKKLGENRNIVAHNPPAIQLVPVTPETPLGARGGVRRKRSELKLKIPTVGDSLAEMSRAWKDWSIPIARIEQWFSDTQRLNRQMLQLSVRIRRSIDDNVDPGWPKTGEVTRPTASAAHSPRYALQMSPRVGSEKLDQCTGSA